MAVFTALAVVGSYIPIPGPIPSLAFDSLAGFFVALYFGVYEGAFVCGAGHMATAILHGFPFGWLHLPIALAMALAGVSIGLAVKMNRTWGFIPGIAVAVIINTVVVFPLSPWIGGMLGAVALVPSLVFAASVNAVIAAVAYVSIRGKFRFDKPLITPPKNS
jgi:hypothetical protein